MKRSLGKKWETYSPISADTQLELKDYHPIIQQVLFSRGITNLQDAHRFLSADGILHDPFSLIGMRDAVARIQRAIDRREKILVFGDYDADGVTATALLVQVLQRLGAFVDKFIPNRFDEGYGFSMNALGEVLGHTPRLLITVDCGIRSLQEVAAAHQHGIDVIITDHHQPLDDGIPQAAAVICPKQSGDDYPYKFLAGVGIAYKLAQALIIASGAEALTADEWLDLVAIGTVADLAPLTGENRILVRKGMDRIKQGSRAGISALLSASGIKSVNTINAGTIGFMLAPRLNAAGRLSTAETAYHLLMTEEEFDAKELAQKLSRENQERQEATRVICQSVEEHFLKSEEEWLLFYAQEGFNEGVVGLAASRMVESFYRPAIIGAVNGEYIRASCRSISELNITRALDQCANLLEKHGGHAMAAGLTIQREKADIFTQRLREIIQAELEGLNLQPTIRAEMEIGLSQLNPAIIPMLGLLEPCGEGNPLPLFISRNVEVQRVYPVGKEKNHLRMEVRSRLDEHNRQRITYSAIAFNLGTLASQIEVGDSIDILFSFDFNEYNGTQSPQLTVRDIKVPHFEKTITR